MEYIYSAMLLHKAGQEVNENNVKKVLESVGIKVEEGKVKALVAALDGVNIEDAIKSAAIPVVPVAGKEETKETKVEEKKEEIKEEEAAAGLGALFG